MFPANATRTNKRKGKRHTAQQRFQTPIQWRARRRVAELMRVFRDRWPKGLPHNREGARFCRYVIQTLAWFTTIDQRDRWLTRYAGWLQGEKVRGQILDAPPHWYGKRSLGEHLELYDADRERLKITTIEAVDVDDDEREVINREKDSKRKERRRRENGVQPRDQYLAESLSRTKPWEAAGYRCRRTWERYGKPGVASVSAPSLIYNIDRTDLRHVSQSCSTKKTKPTHWPSGEPMGTRTSVKSVAQSAIAIPQKLAA